ncbi:hypothetical protein B0H17DRAFT_848811, partial [Mycena rosella]
LTTHGTTLYARFQEQEDPKDLDGAIELHRVALSLRPPTHPDRGNSLINLATVIKTRFDQQGNSEDIKEAIELQQEALNLPAP